MKPKFAHALRSFDWDPLLPLRIQAKAIADGVWLGGHRSLRRGSGVEFAGFREYTPGDDIRRLDRRALLLRDRLLVRQFEVESERECHLLLDASASMTYQGGRAPLSKFEWAKLIAAAIARVVVRGGDPVSISLMAGGKVLPVKRATGAAGFERVLLMLEAASAGGDMGADGDALAEAVGSVGRSARRGALVFVLTDLFDLPPSTSELLRSLMTLRRSVVLLQVMDPDEATFPWTEPARFRAVEGEHVADVVPFVAREGYLAALAALQDRYRTVLTNGGGAFVTAVTDENPVRVVCRAIEHSGAG